MLYNFRKCIYLCIWSIHVFLKKKKREKLKYITQLISLNFTKLHNLYISIQKKFLHVLRCAHSHTFANVPCHDLNIFLYYMPSFSHICITKTFFFPLTVLLQSCSFFPVFFSVVVIVVVVVFLSFIHIRTCMRDKYTHRNSWHLFIRICEK